MDALPLLASIVGVTQEQARSIRLAVVDPAYVASSYPGTLPKVTFEGETTMSTRRYASLYAPQPSDRVVMLPAGTTYVIIGAIDGSATSAASGWTVVQYDNGTSAASGYGTPSSRLDHANGDVVRLSGVIAIPGGLSGGTSIATVTTDHRPSVPRAVTVRSGAGGNVATELTIGTDGTLKPLASLGASATRLGLDHITYVK